MITDQFHLTIENLLRKADIRINGDRPEDIRIKDQRVFKEILSKGSLGLGESYMKGWWDARNLDEFFNKVLSARLEQKIKKKNIILNIFLTRLMNLQSKKRAFIVGKKHYDLNNELYSLMLGRTMAYSCAYWNGSKDLDEAQENKFDLICKKINLKKGMRLLDIGCGWGSFAEYAAKNYGVEVVGITISKEQARFAKEKCRGLPVDIRLMDYRDLNEKFDAIISIGMFEHVGFKNYRKYFRVVNRCLNEDGLFLLHTIGGNKTVRTIEPWIGKYIFPNSMLPSLSQVTNAFEGLFVLEDLHNFGADYDKTLMAWHKNFNKNWPKLEKDYSESFFRMWNYYLLSCAGSFRARKNQLWQFVLHKNGIKEGYRRIS